MLAPGNTFTYYGEEIGIEAPSSNGDANYRTAMIWDNENLPDIKFQGSPAVEKNELGGVEQQLSQEHSLLNTYRKLIKIHSGFKLKEIGDHIYRIVLPIFLLRNCISFNPNSF